MLDQFELRVFISAAKHLSFLKAAKELRTSPSHISKTISELERKVRKKLFQRTTRVVRLSRDGEELLPAAHRAWEALRDTEEFFLTKRDDSHVSGTIRTTCSNTLGIRRLAPIAAKFHELYPDIYMEFFLSDAYTDIIGEGLDVAIRIVKPSDSSLIARKLAENRIIFCASPRYIRAHPPIKTVNDLVRHPIFYIPQHSSLKFRDAGISLADLTLKKGLSWTTAQNGDFLVELAQQGENGILVRSDWGAEREIKAGTLIPLQLNDELVSETAIYAVYAANKFMPKRLRAWLDFLAVEFALS